MSETIFNEPAPKGDSLQLLREFLAEKGQQHSMSSGLCDKLWNLLAVVKKEPEHQNEVVSAIIDMFPGAVLEIVAKCSNLDNKIAYKLGIQGVSGAFHAFPHLDKDTFIAHCAEVDLEGVASMLHRLENVKLEVAQALIKGGFGDEVMRNVDHFSGLDMSKVKMALLQKEDNISIEAGVKARLEKALSDETGDDVPDFRSGDYTGKRWEREELISLGHGPTIVDEYKSKFES
ncbi:MAG TPA: hypothetical protein DEB73_01605 [Candidatus Magasanikbacteria bacterium]|uniref:Uncharacterized protein n=2 Tax=Candidatus Magasanikiibacteriota TaxID=1752731 RepID=A0A0G0WMG2_9BACT|nr:MAG: hypothetical protein UU49_C0002G0002 [Candidatus Magasanikbacteria bacterium GW2011_GWC2_41_17]KKS13267.1 MAG: hypothetical protein UU69_C0009G0002 [Candidatus Magasanikbacteria bacterium GW2011_GWA2_41_55]HBV57942.1 hypothetical protein [Candidatus Magasanikbacteria bacterium]HBX15704.1 hypothetical protein [Candidatus Magasanikbacteria bacterium]